MVIVSEEEELLLEKVNGEEDEYDVPTFCPMTQQEITEQFGKLDCHSSSSSSYAPMSCTASMCDIDDQDAFTIDYWLPAHAAPLAKVYREAFHIRSLYEWQVQCLNQTLTDPNKNLIYCAPTSGGKTMVAEVMMAKRLLEAQSTKTGNGKTKKAMVIAPFISIVEEKTDEFMMKFGESSLGFQCKAFHSNVGAPISTTEFEDLHICVCTIEKANSLINQLIECGRLDEICTLVIDEVHMIMDVHRGYLLELLLAKVLFMNIDCQIIGMSATLPNVAELAKWLNAHLYVSSYRPVPLKEYIKLGNTVYTSSNLNEYQPERALEQSTSAVPDRIAPLLKSLRRTSDDHIPLLCKETITSGGQVLVFCSSKTECATWAKIISLCLDIDSEVSPDLQQERRLLVHTLSRVPTGTDGVLKQTVLSGVAFHHAGLTIEERKIVEDAFRRKIVKVLCCTTTLSAGVNLPSRRCIFVGMRMGLDNIDIVQYKQSCGRAGRAGLDEYGESVIVVSSSESIQQALHLVHSPFPELCSCLSIQPDCLNRALLEVIASGIVLNDEDVQIFSQQTLLSRQIPEAKLSQIIQERMAFLKQQQMIILSPLNQYRETKLGRGCFLSCLSPIESDIVYRDLEDALEGLILRTDLHPIYFCTPLKHNFRINIPEYIRLLPQLDKRVLNKLGINDSGYLLDLQYSNSHVFSKGYNQLIQDKLLFRHYRFYGSLVLADLADELPMSEVSEKYGIPRGNLQQFQKLSATFAGMIATMSYALGWVNLGAIFSNISNRLEYGVKAELVDISTIPGLSAKRARVLYSRGFDSVGKIAAASLDQIVEVMTQLIPFPQSDNQSEFQAKLQIEKRVASEIIHEARKLIETRGSDETLVNFYSTRGSQTYASSPPRTTQPRIVYTSPKRRSLNNQLSQVPHGHQTLQPTSQQSNFVVDKTRRFKPIELPHRSTVATPDSVLGKRKVISHTDTPDGSPAAKKLRLEDNPDRSPKPLSKTSDAVTAPIKHKYDAPYKVVILRGDDSLIQDKTKIIDLFKRLSNQNSFGMMIHTRNEKGKSKKKVLLQVKCHTRIAGIFFCIPEVENGIEAVQTVYYLKLGYPIQEILLNVLRKFFKSRKETKIYSFCMKDQWKVLHENGISLSSGRFVDVQIADWILKPDDKKKNRDSLDVLYKSHLATPMENPTNTPEVECEDKDFISRCVATVYSFRLGIYLRTLMSNSRVLTPFDKLEMRLIPSLALMEANGFAFNTDIMPHLQGLLQVRKRFLEDEIQAILKKRTISSATFSAQKDIASPKKVAELLFKHLKLEAPTGSKGTNKEVLVKLMKQYSNDRDMHTVLSNIKEIRNLSSMLTKQITPFNAQHVLHNSTDGTNRIYASQLQIASETGRLATINPNLQNIPHDIWIPGDSKEKISISVRRGFTVSDSEQYVLMSADYRQIECRMMAHLADDAILINIMNESKRDLFEEIACEFFGHRDVQLVTSEERDTVKTVFYGIMYGMGPSRLGESIKDMREKSGILSNGQPHDYTDEAKKYIDTLMARFPGIRNYTRKIIPEMLEKHGYVQTLSGRKRHLEEAKSKNQDEIAAGRRKALSTVCQGSAADLIKIAMIHITNDLFKLNGTDPIHSSVPKAKMVLQIHDELIFEVRKDCLQEIALMVKYNMENAAIIPIAEVADNRQYIPYTVIEPLKVQTPVKLQIGNNWGEMKEFVVVD